MSKAKSHKKISALDVVRWLLLLVALVAAVLLVKRLLEYKKGQDTYKDIASQFTASVSAEADVGSALLQVCLLYTSGCWPAVWPRPSSGISCCPSSPGRPSGCLLYTSPASGCRGLCPAGNIPCGGP